MKESMNDNFAYTLMSLDLSLESEMNSVKKVIENLDDSNDEKRRTLSQKASYVVPTINEILEKSKKIVSVMEDIDSEVGEQKVLRRR